MMESTEKKTGMEPETMIDAEFKDASPLKTVERIRQILKDNKIEVRERWNESGVPYCFSMRLTVAGTTFGVNGKGLTKEFTLASAYGELMERFQFGSIGTLGIQKGASFSNREINCIMVDAEKHLEANLHWYEALTKRLYEYTGQELEPKRVLDHYKTEDGKVRVMEHYNLTKREKSCFPVELHRIYNTNGAAAGNTPEEALVQAISETVERHNHLQIVREGLAMPDIPEEVLKKYNTAYKIITYVRQQGFRVIIKDASLGQKFPVVCAVFIQEKTGKYHTHFGACPVFEIALERALTESFQGRNLENLAKFENFHYENSAGYAARALAEELIVGTAEKFVDILVGTPEYAYNENMGFEGKNNKELAKECINYFRDMGFDILVRDRSSLGFPALQVIIPGYSECIIQRLGVEHNESAHMRVFRDPCAASEADMETVRKILKQKTESSGSKLRSTFSKMSILAVKLPETLDEQLLCGTKAYVAYHYGEYDVAAENLSRIIELRAGRNVESLICLKRYLKMKAHGYDEDRIRTMVETFHRAQTCKWLYESIADGANPFVSFVLHCDGKCTQDCLLNGMCNQKYTQQLIDLIMKKISELSFDEACSTFEKFEQ